MRGLVCWCDIVAASVCAVESRIVGPGARRRSTRVAEWAQRITIAPGYCVTARRIPPFASPPHSNQFERTPFEGVRERAPRPHDSLTAIDQFIRAEDLSVVFQPIVHMDSLRVFAYEALVRCRVPEFAYPPTLFERAVSERCSGRLGRMIRQVAVPLCSGHPLFLNVHPIELQERWLVQPDDALYFHDHDVFVEITESVPMTHFELCFQVLREVRSRNNVHLVVDDLGAGYSNLKRIADLEPAVVKLDRGLIAGVTTHSRQHRLVRSVVQLCVDLGARVVAEGIETVDEYRALLDTGVHFGQGYLFARPAFPLPPVSTDALTR
jgi:EAL domain-containing protein (putative c-di-GMP-specific phosphodiesterase class I)